jgi:hypothetical protein
MTRVYQYDYIRKREKLVRFEINPAMMQMVDVSPVGGVDEFMKDFCDRLVADRWMSGWSKCYKAEIPSWIIHQMTPDMQFPDGMFDDSAKMLNSHGDIMCTHVVCWGEKWSEEDGYYRSNTLVFG